MLQRLKWALLGKQWGLERIIFGNLPEHESQKVSRKEDHIGTCQGHGLYLVCLRSLVWSDDEIYPKLGKFHQLFITGKRTVLQVCCPMGKHSPKGKCVLSNPKCYCISYPSVSKRPLPVYGPAAQPEPQLWDGQGALIPFKGLGLTLVSLCLPIFSGGCYLGKRQYPANLSVSLFL